MSTTQGGLPVSIYQSFYKALDPLLTDPVPSGYRAMPRSTTDSTMNEEPPKAFLKEDGVILRDLGLSHLRNSPGLSSTLNQPMPQHETGHRLSTEGDVVRASILYLLHPVNVAVSSLISRGDLYCKTEQSSRGRTCRTDIRWVYQPDRNDQSNQTDIAVLEVKNTKTLHWADFSAAGTDQQNARAKVRSAYAKGADEEFTHLVRNALWVSKQAKKYATTLPVADVAIFDWNAIFVFDFAGMKEDTNDPILARGIWFEEPTTNVQDGTTFRALLLGFLVRALRRHHVIP